VAWRRVLLVLSCSASLGEVRGHVCTDILTYIIMFDWFYNHIKNCEVKTDRSLVHEFINITYFVPTERSSILYCKRPKLFVLRCCAVLCIQVQAISSKKTSPLALPPLPPLLFHASTHDTYPGHLQYTSSTHVITHAHPPHPPRVVKGRIGRHVLSSYSTL
jgi:hypothetical protein